MSATDGNEVLDLEQVFDLSAQLRHGAVRVRSLELLHNAFEIGRGEFMPAEPVEFVRDSGHTADDLVGTSYATLHLASARLVEVLERCNFTGWTTFPVMVHLDDNGALGRYFGLGVTGRCGQISDALSERVELPPPIPGGRASPGLRGLLFDPHSWDGSDIFTPADRASIFVTAEVRSALNNEALTGLEFRSITTIERPILGSG